MNKTQKEYLQEAFNEVKSEDKEKRFSIIKFIKDIGEERFVEEVESYKKYNAVPWWVKCQGMTEEEMEEIGLFTIDAWME